MTNKQKIESSGLFEKDIMPGVDWYYSIPESNFCFHVDEKTDEILIAQQGDLTAGRTYRVRNYGTLICIIKLLKLI